MMMTSSYLVEGNSGNNTKNTNTNTNGIIKKDFFSFSGLNDILFTCCEKGIDNGLIEFVIQYGANINEENYHYNDDCNLNTYGYTPLMIACYYGHEHIVKNLLYNNNYYNNTINCNYQCSKNGLTPLMVASQYGHKHIVQTLLLYNNNTTTNNTTNNNVKVNVNIQDKMGNTALIYAAYYGYNKIVKILLTQCMDDIDIYINDNFGRTALQYATEQKHTKIIKTLKGPTTKLLINMLIGKNIYVPPSYIRMKKEEEMRQQHRQRLLRRRPKKTIHEMICQVLLP